MKHLLMIITVTGLLTTASCKRGFEPIEYGKDACAHCKMTIVDDRYAAELLTTKGRAYKFDDILCMKQFTQSNATHEIAAMFVEDYLRNSAEPLIAENAVYLKHEFFASPMNGDYAAFSDAAEAKKLSDSLNVPILKWENLE